MIKYRLPLVSTLSVFMIACGSGSPLENPASVPTTPSTGAATSDIAAPGIPDSGSGDTGNDNTDLPEPGDNGGKTQSAQETPAGESDPSIDTVTLPVTCSASDEDIRHRMLDLINSARTQARNCGTTPYAATAPLTWNTQLVNAAKVHSQDMAQHNFFDHTGSNGSSVADRATAAGFTWQRIGENIAAGQPSAESAVNGWLDSPGHCRNLMNPDFTQVSVACVEDAGSDYVRYWTNVLGTPF